MGARVQDVIHFEERFIIQPKKKPKGGELSTEEKAQNTAISRERIRVEHSIGGALLNECFRYNRRHDKEKTNYKSEKGNAIENNNKVSLHFYWPELERQIRISGYAEKTDIETSKNYFHSRPQKSQVAASISEQSSVVTSREYLETKFNELSGNLKGKNPEFPNNWGGYRVSPVKFEFWQGRESRLHDRIIYEKDGANWVIKRLAP